MVEVNPVIDPHTPARTPRGPVLCGAQPRVRAHRNSVKRIAMDPSPSRSQFGSTFPKANPPTVMPISAAAAAGQTEAQDHFRQYVIRLA